MITIRNGKYVSIWTPSTRLQLTNWISKRYQSEGRNLTLSDIKKLTKKQLYAMYYKMRGL